MPVFYIEKNALAAFISVIFFLKMDVFQSHSAANYMYVLCEQFASEHVVNMRAHCHKIWSYNNLILHKQDACKP